jgi:hypothetical protein
LRKCRPPPFRHDECHERAGALPRPPRPPRIARVRWNSMANCPGSGLRRSLRGRVGVVTVTALANSCRASCPSSTLLSSAGATECAGRARLPPAESTRRARRGPKVPFRDPRCRRRLRSEFRTCRRLSGSPGVMVFGHGGPFGGPAGASTRAFQRGLGRNEARASPGAPRAVARRRHPTEPAMRARTPFTRGAAAPRRRRTGNPGAAMPRRSFTPGAAVPVSWLLRAESRSALGTRKGGQTAACS